MKIPFIEWVYPELHLNPNHLESCRFSFHNVTMHKLDNRQQYEHIMNELEQRKVTGIIDNFLTKKRYNQKDQCTPRRNRLSTCADSSHSLNNATPKDKISPIYMQNYQGGSKLQPCSPYSIDDQQNHGTMLNYGE